MLGSPRMSSSVTSRRVPRPLHAGHAPNGELNEKCRGSSSGNEIPQTGHPYRSEKSASPGSCALAVRRAYLDQTVGQPQRRLDRVGETRPVLGAHHESVDDDRDGVILPAIELGRIGQLDQLPSTTARMNPCFRADSNSSRNSPLRPRTSGARTSSGCPAAR